MQPIGVFGGTFDPIHCGHLRTAFELWQELRLAEVRFLPTGSPPHRAQLYASPGWRPPTAGPLGEVMVDHGTGTIRVLHERPSGCVYVHAVTQLEISSTELRSLIIAGRDPRYLVPDEVRQIILETRCYAAQQEPGR